MKEKEENREARHQEALETGSLVMAEFYASWCPHCQRMMPVVEEFKKANEGKVEVVQIDIEQEAPLADRYTVESIPTFILLRNGEPIWRQSGELTVERLQEAIDKMN